MSMSVLAVLGDGDGDVEPAVAEAPGAGVPVALVGDLQGNGSGLPWPAGQFGFIGAPEVNEDAGGSETDDLPHGALLSLVRGAAGHSDPMSCSWDQSIWVMIWPRPSSTVTLACASAGGVMRTVRLTTRMVSPPMFAQWASTVA